MKTLIIVESVKKARQLQSMFGKEYIVLASMGHVMDLPIKELGVDVSNGFEEKYVINPDKNVSRAKNIKMIKEKAKLCSKIILASDLDREGESIAWSLKKMLGLKNPARIVFADTTKKTILSALENPQTINMNLVDAQRTRRVLDRIIGYTLSPLLQKQITMSAKSAGRVQSVVVRMVYDKEKDVEDFYKSDLAGYFKTAGYFANLPPCSLYDNSDKVKRLVKEEIKPFLKKRQYKINEVNEKEVEQFPQPPFHTATLQQECSGKLKLSNKETMSIAQHLYELGLITYMRTDSVALSAEVKKSTKKYIVDKYGIEYHREATYKENKSSQEAHECIRPTKINCIPENLTDIEKKMYDLIWRRTVASQMQPAIIRHYLIKINVLEYYFLSDISDIEFPGYMILDDFKENKYIVPKINQQVVLEKIIVSEEYKNPPERYSETTINKQMNKHGIGRPATTASILDKVLKREYVVKKNHPGIEKDAIEYTFNGGATSTETKKVLVGKEKNKYTLTPLGSLTTEFLLEHYASFIDYQYTALIEKDLDLIAKGEKERVDVLNMFYAEFKKNISAKKEKVLGKCPNTGEDIISTVSKYGKVLKVGDKYVKVSSGEINLTDAIKLVNSEYPKELGRYKNKLVKLYKGKDNFFARIDKEIVGLEKEEDLEGVIDAYKNKKGQEKFVTYQTKKYQIMHGKFGYYLQHKWKGKTFNYSVPKELDANNLSKEDIQNILKKYKRY